MTKVSPRKFYLNKQSGYQDRVVARLNANNLSNNFQILAEMSGPMALVLMVKADGYGHGATWVAKTLSNERKIAGFGVATLWEGTALRLGLSEVGFYPDIYVFSGCTPWTPEAADLCRKNRFTVVITSLKDLHNFGADARNRDVKVHLKWNTGMNRLGLSPSDLGEVIDFLIKHKWVKNSLEGCFSHLAAAEDPKSWVSQIQMSTWKQIVEQLRFVAPDVFFHLGNSSALWNHKAWDLKKNCQLVRPGISLYGIPPFKGAKTYGIRPVMNLEAAVMQIKSVPSGSAVGYGSLVRVKAETRVAIVSAGYADGILHRSQANQSVLLSGQKTPILGTISMDLCAVKAHTGTKTGDAVRFLGEGLEPWEQASELGTIPYQLLTAVSPRVVRLSDDRT